MHTTDTTGFQKLAKKKIPSEKKIPGEKKAIGRPLGAVNYTRRVPVAVTRCRYCRHQIVTYGAPEKYAAWLALGLGNRGQVERVYLPGRKTAKLVPWETPRPCHICMRDIWHFKQHGKYPDYSILWELRLNDRSLR